MSVTSLSLDALVKLVSDDSEIPCPHCGHVHELSDPDVVSSVVSYWGDEIHDFSCFGCGEDFVIEERVTRQFTTAKTIEDLHDD